MPAESAWRPSERSQRAQRWTLAKVPNPHETMPKRIGLGGAEDQLPYGCGVAFAKPCRP